MSAGRMILHWN